MTCGPDDWDHDFKFRDDDRDDVNVCDCGQVMVLFDPDTGDMTGIRSVP
jgi:hypothetical protein